MAAATWIKASKDVRQLTSAHYSPLLAAPPIICSLASRAVRGWGWGDRSDAPSTPLRLVYLVYD